MIDPRKGLKSTSFSYLGSEGMQRDVNFTSISTDAMPPDLEMATGWHDHRAWCTIFRRKDLERGGKHHIVFSVWLNGLRKRMEAVAYELPFAECEKLALEYSRL